MTQPPPQQTYPPQQAYPPGPPPPSAPQYPPGAQYQQQPVQPPVQQGYAQEVAPIAAQGGYQQVPTYGGQPAVVGVPAPGQPQPGQAMTAPTWYQPPVKRVEVQKIKDSFTNEWETPLLCAGFNQPLWCLGGFFCAPCAVFLQRKKLLMIDNSESNWQYYVCCGGIWGRECCKSCTTGNECFCLGLESCCFTGCAAHGNRFMIQVHYGLQNTCCDLFLFYFRCFCKIAAIILRNEMLENLADLLFYLLIGCMTAQHEDEMCKKGYPQGYNIKGPRAEQM